MTSSGRLSKENSSSVQQEYYTGILLDTVPYCSFTEFDNVKSMFVCVGGEVCKCHETYRGKMARHISVRVRTPGRVGGKRRWWVGWGAARLPAFSVQ